MRIVNRRGHKNVGFVTGITKHKPLIACAFILIVTLINAQGDIGGLLMQIILEFKMRMMEFILLIANIPDRRPHRRLDLLHDTGNFILGCTHLTAQNDTVGRRHGFARNTRNGISLQKQIKDRIGYTVTYFVRVPFGHGFRREKI